MLCQFYEENTQNSAYENYFILRFLIKRIIYRLFAVNLLYLPYSQLQVIEEKKDTGMPNPASNSTVTPSVPAKEIMGMSRK